MTQLADAYAWLDLVERLSYYDIWITGMQNLPTVSAFNPNNSKQLFSTATQLVVQLFLMTPYQSSIQNANMNRSWN